MRRTAAEADSHVIQNDKRTWKKKKPSFLKLHLNPVQIILNKGLQVA